MPAILPEHRWGILETLFHAAIELPAEQRAGFADRACGDDHELRIELLSLLRYDAELQAREGDLVDALQLGAASLIQEQSPVGQVLGSYRIEREIGRGGMAVVYLAVRADGEFQQRVAVKLIRRGMDTASVIERLRRERRILAALEHPSIARLLDGGTTADGRPWIAMEYIEGLPIDRFCEQHGLSIEERCALIEKVCEAVAYAHGHLVVHRDLKPSNILVLPDGAPKLLDFGIAKLLADGETDGEPLTRGPSLPLTPEYASPEQIRRGTVTTASDVYSLGVVLYEVLTGERPYRAASPDFQELERAVCDTEIKAPSTLEAVPRRTRRRLAGDLDNIVLMALRKDVARRYGSALQLAEDLRRHLQGLPVRARRDTVVYRAGKFLRRYRTAAAAVFLAAASVLTAAVIAGREARAARERFDQLRGFARTVLVDLHAQLSDIPGTAKARQALVAYVDDYLKKVAAQRAGDDTAFATEFATTYLRLGEVQGATPQAIASFENGRRLLERKSRPGAIAPEDSLLLARLRVREGSALVDLQRPVEGVENLLAGARLAAGIGQAHGWNAEAELVQAFAHWRLGHHYRIENRLAEAEDHARQAITGVQEILRRGFRSREAEQILTGSRNVLGGVLRRRGHWQQSMETYRAALSETEARAAADPASAGLQRELARSHQIVGDMVMRIPGHDINEVRLHVRGAIAIAERLAALDPGDKTAQSDLAEYLSSGAEMLRTPQDWNEALGYSRRALPILQTLLNSEPDNETLRLYAALTEADIGGFLARTRSKDQAIAWFRRGVADLTRLVAGDPRNTVNQLELITMQQRFSLCLVRGGRGAEAIALAQDSMDKARLVAGDMGATPESWRELPRAYSAMGDIYRALGRLDAARKWYRLAVAEWERMTARGIYFPDSETEMAAARKGAS